MRTGIDHAVVAPLAVAHRLIHHEVGIGEGQHHGVRRGEAKIAQSIGDGQL